MRGEKKPLYRKYNKTARGFHENSPGGDFRHERNSKAFQNFEGTHKSIRRTQGGMDYTPLYKFLLSKVGQPWEAVHSEAVSRIDDPNAVYDIIVTDPLDKRETTYMGESTQYSLLKVDDDGILVKVNPDAVPNGATCTCCTHTFNGKVMTNKHEYLLEREAIWREPVEKPIVDYDAILREKKEKTKLQEE